MAPRTARPWWVAVISLVVLAAAGGCAGSPRDETTARGGPSVVTSTDVWGSVAQAVAGPDAEVTSIVSGTVDPHSYQPPPSVAAAISDADLVVYNGGGYDAWVTAVLGGRGGSGSIDAYSLLDAEAVGEPQPANEHVFYELNTVKAVAGRIADRLAEIDPSHAAGYRSRATEFEQRAQALLDTQRGMRGGFPDAAVVATEPVAHYLVLAAGLKDKTPVGFTSAVEQDTDAAPADLAAMLDLISEKSVAAVLFNDQTVTGATRRIRDAAQNAGVPVVTVTETLPSGSDYLGWQTDTTERLTAALREPR